MTSFSTNVLMWFDQHGRKHLPWQQDITPYRVWISEIMLQQTQVKTVIPYFERFMASFPTLEALADAPEDEVLNHWSGLGYYARARNMHKAAKQVCDEFSGHMPDELEQLQSLPGIGRSTAGAILSIAHQQKQAILDGNVKRVLCRCFAIKGWTGKSTVLKKLWRLAEDLLPDARYADYTQAMMDLGATVCTRTKPSCDKCPLLDECKAFKLGRQTDYPTKKPKKTLPEKSVTLLILKHKNTLYFQKRPPTGIWGGLWSFPEFKSEDAVSTWLADKGINIQSKINLEVLVHTFSHYRLSITPLIITCKTPIKRGVMEKDESLWYNMATEFKGGLPAPIQRLLNQIKETEHGKNGELHKTG